LSKEYHEYQVVAERLAVAAGRLLRGAYGRVAAREKGPGDLVTDADLASQRLIAEELHRAFPEHTLLAEEEGATADPERAWRWIVDPLDGTINFAHGFPFWCVSIALEHLGRLVVGVVYNPLTHETYSASLGRGATLDGRAIHVSAVERLDASLVAAALPTNFPADAPRQLAYLQRLSTGTHSIRRTGSSALNLAILATGGCEICYATHMYPWDAAAGVVLVREAGGVVSNFAGDDYDLYQGETLATNGRLHEATVRAFAEAWPGD
jgi:myo-inositol-1(or 4)-monophosphatase